ncbi:SIMPL domain-containing protein [Agromyces sp. Marseille-Q5079]|uniref:SIMPL domain-containing protein n=1 Tax=Agromyces sp. Marseille-Q5079 TaxID=3439059 RepID=UPI003D9CA6EC
MPTTISVSGRAELRVAPELAAVTLSIGDSGADREGVAERTAAAHTRLLDAIRELEASGVLEAWSADQVRVWSFRPWNDQGAQLPLVHQSSAEVEVVFRDLVRVGEWLGEAAPTEALTIGGIDWRLTDQTLATTQEAAQRAAVTDAVAKAAVYASALGLGTPVVVELADHGMLSAVPAAMPGVMAMRGDKASGGPTEFSPQDLVITAAVDARFSADAA